MDYLDNNWDRIDRVLNRKELLISPTFALLMQIQSYSKTLQQTLKRNKLVILARLIQLFETYLLLLFCVIRRVISLLVDLSLILLLCLTSSLLIVMFEQILDSYWKSSLLIIASELILFVLVKSNQKKIEQHYWSILAISTKITRMFRLITKKKYSKLKNLDEELWEIWKDTTTNCVCEYPAKAKKVITKLRRQIVVAKTLYNPKDAHLTHIFEESALYLELLKY
jgi:hypothetical protein